jgi:hypothetical protein
MIKIGSRFRSKSEKMVIGYKFAPTNIFQLYIYKEMVVYNVRPVGFVTPYGISWHKEGISCMSVVNEQFNKMVAIRLVYAKIIIFSGFIHRTLTNESSNTIADPGHTFWLQSLIGNEEIIPKLTTHIEEFISPILKNSTNVLCRNHSDIYIGGLRNGTPWAYHSK